MSDKYLINSSTLTGIASAIRSKTGSTSAFTPAQMISEIENMGIKIVYPMAYRIKNIVSYTGSEQCILVSAFVSCKMLSTVSFINCNIIDVSAFAFCIKLNTILFPNCSYIGPAAFMNCVSLSAASFPKCSYIDYSAFLACSSLKVVSLPICGYIGGGAFRNCTALSSLYLNQVSAVPTLANDAVFYNSPLLSDGKIYVPKSLYTSFITDTIWSSISARLVSV